MTELRRSRRPRFTWQLRTRTLSLGERTLLMGIVNVTPDSFSDGGQFLNPHSAVDHGLSLLDGGADLLDLGGESTRPDATPLSAEEEQARILPVLRGLLRARPAAVVSVDTYHAATAQAALNAGAEVINDVSGLLWDQAMAGVLARAKPGVVLMHTRGRPPEWKTLPPLAADAVVPMVLSGLAEALERARDDGLPAEHIVLDPGFGFGKRGAENLPLLAGLAGLHTLGRPLLVGLSRKRFLTTDPVAPTAAEREHATSAAHMAVILAGAQILRTHDIRAVRSVAALADAILCSADLGPY